MKISIKNMIITYLLLLYIIVILKITGILGMSFKIAWFLDAIKYCEIRIPFVGGLLSPNRQFFPKYDLGKYDKNNSTMIVTKGLGGSKVLVRINCKPEIVKIILKSKHY